MSSVGDWFDKELCWISGHSYQIIESSFSKKFYYASLRDRLKEGPQWVKCVILITTLLQHCTFQEYVAQLSESGHNADKELVVLGTKYGILWPWNGHFGVGLSQPPQLWSGRIGLHLFNDDTCSSGHISRPSQVGFSHNCLRYKQII